MRNSKKYKVLRFISGPWSSPYVCTCKSLKAAQAAIFKNANKEHPHKLIKKSETDFVAYVNSPGEEFKPHYKIEIC